MPVVDPGGGAGSHQVLQNIINANYEKKQLSKEQKGEDELTSTQKTESQQQDAQGQRITKQQSQKGAEAQAREAAPLQEEEITPGKKERTTQTTTTAKTRAGMGTVKESVSKGATTAETVSAMLTSKSPSSKPGLAKPWEVLIEAEANSISSTKGINLIAIMSEVMVLQAKSNQDFFKSLWQGASEAMNMEAELAPVVAKATLQAGLAQAAQSKAEGSKALIEGVVSLTTFVASVGFGIGMGMAASAGAEGTEDVANTGLDVKNLTKDASETDETISGAGEDVAATAGTDGSAAANTADPEAVAEADSDAAAAGRKGLEKAETKGAEETDAIEKKTTKGAEKAALSRMAAAKKAVKEMHPALKGLIEATNASMLMNGLSQGINGIVTYVYSNRIAAYQIKAAEWQAVEKMGDIQVQFFGQAFGRAEGMSQQAQQNINTALQLLEGMVSAITQTVTSGFANI